MLLTSLLASSHRALITRPQCMRGMVLLLRSASNHHFRRKSTRPSREYGAAAFSFMATAMSWPCRFTWQLQNFQHTAMRIGGGVDE